MVKRLKLKKKYFIMFATLSFLGIFLVIMGISYAYFTTTAKSKEFVIYTGNLVVDYEKKTDVINLDNLYPMADTEGLSLTAHEFNVKNNGNIDARYQVRLELDNSVKDMISPEYIKIAYSIDGSSYSDPVLLSNLDTSLAFIRNRVLEPTGSNTIAVKLWIDLNAPNEIQGKEFKAKIVVDSIQDVEDGYVVDTIPIIYLNKDENGNHDINLKTGETYTELGVERIEDDQEVFSVNQVQLSYEYYDGTSLSTVTSLDTSKNGVYYVTYSITDKSGNVGKSIRVVTVNDTGVVPSITLNGDATVTIEQMDNYEEHGVTVTDNNQVAIIGEVKTSTIGTYLVRYIVIDSNGNLNSVVRTINVVEATTLYSKIFTHNTLIEAEPTLTTSSNNTEDVSGLYKSTSTNDGNPTYYFRGSVINNYVDFAGFTWRIVRVNEDGTIRLIMQDGINDNTGYAFNSDTTMVSSMYYSNSEIKTQLETWYTTNISANSLYSSKVSIGDYFCEQAKVSHNSYYISNSGANMTLYNEYVPNFKCEIDANGYGIISSSIGLLTYDEIVYAGGYFDLENDNYYLYNYVDSWTMSTAGFSGNNVNVWRLNNFGGISSNNVVNTYKVIPVINIKNNTKAVGLGTSEKPYKVIY